MTPTIIQENQKINLKLDYEISEILNEKESIKKEQKTNIPTASIRHIITNVTVNPNDYIILGGLDKEKEIIIKNGIPFLRRIPLLGLFFSSTEKKKVKTKLYIATKVSSLQSIDLQDFQNLKNENLDKMTNKGLDKLK